MCLWDKNRRHFAGISICNGFVCFYWLKMFKFTFESYIMFKMYIKNHIFRKFIYKIVLMFLIGLSQKAWLLVRIFQCINNMFYSLHCMYSFLFKLFPLFLLDCSSFYSISFLSAFTNLGILFSYSAYR